MAKKKASKRATKKVTKKKAVKKRPAKKRAATTGRTQTDKPNPRAAPTKKKAIAKKKAARSTTRKGAAKSAYHICFARGTLGNTGSWKAVKPEDVQHGDWEFFTDKHGIGLNRVGVTAEIKLLKGYKGLGIRGADKSFMKRARVGATCVQSGWRLIEDLCNQMRVPMPIEALRRKQAYMEHLNDSQEAVEKLGHGSRTKKRTSASRSTAASSFVLPDGWEVQTKKKSTTGQEYKVFISPEGKKLYSRVAVQRHISAA